MIFFTSQTCHIHANNNHNNNREDETRSKRCMTGRFHHSPLLKTSRKTATTAIQVSNAYLLRITSQTDRFTLVHCYCCCFYCNVLYVDCWVSITLICGRYGPSPHSVQVHLLRSTHQVRGLGSFSVHPPFTNFSKTFKTLIFFAFLFLFYEPVRSATA